MPMRIENDIPPPDKVRATRKRTAKVQNPSSQLINALKFVGVIQKKHNYCSISGHWAATSNGILTIGHPVEENLEACPQTFLLIDALTKATKELSIVQIDSEVLSISSGAFRALVPCISSTQMKITPPDPMTCAVLPSLQNALGAVAGILLDEHEREVYTAVLMQSGSSCVATNGAAILEYWHSSCWQQWDDPEQAMMSPDFLIPKQAAIAVAKAPYVLVGIGWSDSSVTFHFEGGSFIKTQVYNLDEIIYPEYNELFATAKLTHKPVPVELMKAVRAVQTYSEDGHVHFEGTAVQSKQSPDEASTYRIEGLPSRMAFSAKHLKSVEHAFKSAEFDTIRNLVIFYGDDMPIRGMLCGVDMPTIGADDIPF